MIGLWAVCGAGRIGKIEREGKRSGGPCFFGTGLDGQPWQSIAPHLLHPRDQVVLNER